MNSQSMNMNRPAFFWLACGLIMASLMSLASSAAPQAVSKAHATPQAKPRIFDTPDQAAEALVQAAEKFDVAALEAIFGPNGHDLILTGEPVGDKEFVNAFAAQAREKMKVSIDPRNTNRAILIIGNNDWPTPVPIVKSGGKWYFDAKAGRQELLYRRIGRNELDAIEICRGFVEAQHEYALEKHEGFGVNQYAQRIISTPGKQDGLAWKNPDGSWGGPVGEEIARVIERGYSSRSEPYHGYYFKVLKGQGPAAPLGEMDFIVNGVMIGGFALIAAPAQYRVTGVKTFMVSHDGVVYQKDLGPNTLEIAKKIERFNPDKTWSPVEER
ncbi:MAG: DUF2950 domain-containing protein [Acidobacteriales bacterium]|nr:DUF2950 domain-containing protein [Terriglobales bacterium]